MTARTGTRTGKKSAFGRIFVRFGHGVRSLAIRSDAFFSQGGWPVFLILESAE